MVPALVDLGKLLMNEPLPGLRNHYLAEDVGGHNLTRVTSTRSTQDNSLSFMSEPLWGFFFFGEDFHTHFPDEETEAQPRLTNGRARTRKKRFQSQIMNVLNKLQCLTWHASWEAQDKFWDENSEKRAKIDFVLPKDKQLSNKWTWVSGEAASSPRKTWV